MPAFPSAPANPGAALPEFSPAETEALRQRFSQVLERLQTALRKSGRSLPAASPNASPTASPAASGPASDPGVALVAISKFHPAEKLAALARIWRETCPQLPLILGENYLQEALAKQDVLAAQPELADLPELASPAAWHFCGHLQSKKARQFSGRFGLLHTLDSINLAQNLQKYSESRAAELDASGPQPVLLQVNIGEEGQKSGLAPADCAAFIEELQGFSAIRLRGLMCLPPFSDEAEDSRPYFIRLRQMRDSLEKQLGLDLPELSMGMSHDFEIAVEEGATLVRIGTDIFGSRGY